MSIDKTNVEERLVICQIVDPAFTYVSRARRLLMKVLADFFEDAEQKSISHSDAEDVRDILHAVNDALWMAETDYFTTTGQYWAVPGGEYHYEGAKRALLVREVEQLRSKLGHEVTKECMALDDEKALPILQEIAKRKGGDQ